MLKVGLDNLVIDEGASQVTKTADITLDLSGVAKGYAVDQVANLLSDLKVESYFIEVGGEIKIKGLKPDNQEWIPAIEAPVYGSSQLYALLRSLGETISLAGSGDYRNYYERGGVRYSHEIDPRTGKPITHNLAAVFVIDESAARADALATAFMVLGPREAQELILQEEIKALLIFRIENSQFQSFISDGFSRYLVK
jgi:thiamine biosynthesis lipoprotein